MGEVVDIGGLVHDGWDQMFHYVSVRLELWNNLRSMFFHLLWFGIVGYPCGTGFLMTPCFSMGWMRANRGGRLAAFRIPKVQDGQDQGARGQEQPGPSDKSAEAAS